MKNAISYSRTIDRRNSNLFENRIQDARVRSREFHFYFEQFLLAKLKYSTRVVNKHNSARKKNSLGEFELTKKSESAHSSRHKNMCYHLQLCTTASLNTRSSQKTISTKWSDAREKRERRRNEQKWNGIASNVDLAPDGVVFFPFSLRNTHFGAKRSSVCLKVVLVFARAIATFFLRSTFGCPWRIVDEINQLSCD